MAEQIRQGDVLLIPVEETPPQGLRGSNQVILAEGEATGHAHRLMAKDILEWNIGDQRYVRVVGADMGELSHEDHDPIPVSVVEPEVTYRIISQRETDLSGQWRKVVD